MTDMIRSFRELTMEQQPLAGGKGGTLARLYQAGYPVPDGFVILPAAFEDTRLKPEAWTQVQTNLQLVTHVIDFGLHPQEAVEAPRWRSLQNPTESTVPHTCSNVLQLEGRFSKDVARELAGKGHRLEILADWGGPGNAQAIMFHPESKALIGGSDPRMEGYAVAW